MPVHFLRFELSPAMLAAWNDGAHVELRSTHPARPVAATLTPDQRHALAADFG